MLWTFHKDLGTGQIHWYDPGDGKANVGGSNGMRVYLRWEYEEYTQNFCEETFL
jgi:hypothetical protein